MHPLLNIYLIVSNKLINYNKYKVPIFNTNYFDIA